jgi:ATP-dependent DNA helicase RecG
VISYEGVQRVETYPVPEEALRESLHNAVAHKDYSSGVPIQISVYEDKILFWNNGELYEGWTVNTLVQKHSSQPFNPDVAHTFFRAGMIEAWGRGIEHMIDACKAADVPEPLLRYEPPGLWVEFPIRMVQRPDKIRVGTTQKTTPKIPQKILAILEENPSASRREIAERLADITEDGVKYHLDRLKAAGKIRRIGPARGGHWEVQDDAHE